MSNNPILATQQTVTPSETANDLKLMYSKTEAAEMLSVSLRTLENLIATKELLVRRVGKRVLVPYRSLLQFVRRDHKTREVGSALEVN